MTSPAPLAASDFGPAPDAVELVHLFDMHYGLSLPTDVGTVAHGRRVYFSTTGGRFEGPRLSGEILPGGSDWTLTGADGTSRIDVHLLMKTDAGALIHAEWTGKMRAAPGTFAAITDPDKRAGIDDSRVYFRTAPTFETAAKDLAWLTHMQCVASARFTRAGLSYRVMGIR